MEPLKLLAIVPPLLVWIVIYLYANRIDGRVKALESEMKGDGRD